MVDHGDSFVLIQNGVGVEKALRGKLPTATIISGCSWVDATVVEGGTLLTQYGPVGVSFGTALVPVLFIIPQEHLTLGTHPIQDGTSEGESLKLLAELLLKGGTKPEPESDIEAHRWRKVLW